MGHEALAMIEFNDMPSLLVLADGAAAAERARRSAERAGCRVSDVAAIDGAVERLDRQAGMDAVLLEIEDDAGESLDRLLDGLEQAAVAGRHGSIVSAPASLIDLVAARTRHPRVIHLCAADEMERVAAIALAAARPRHRLQDIGREQGPPQLQQISEEVGRIANMLASLSAAEGQAEISEPGEEEKESSIEPGLVRAVIRARRLRDQFLQSDLFADPAWDILLDLFAARLERRRVAVSSLCIAAAVPPTTALRWIKMLTDVGLLVRVADPRDGRRVHIELAPKTTARLDAYFTAAQRLSPLTV